MPNQVFLKVNSNPLFPCITVYPFDMGTFQLLSFCLLLSRIFNMLCSAQSHIKLEAYGTAWYIIKNSSFVLYQKNAVASKSNIKKTAVAFGESLNIFKWRKTVIRGMLAIPKRTMCCTISIISSIFLLRAFQ